MAFTAVLAGVLLCVAFCVRERHLRRERAATAEALRDLRIALEATRAQLRRAGEDVFVLQTLLAERNLLDDGDLARARIRLIETPRRLAEERAAMARHLQVSPTQLVLDPNDPKIH